MFNFLVSKTLPPLLKTLAEVVSYRYYSQRLQRRL